MKPRIGLSGQPRLADTVLGRVTLHGVTRFYVDSVRRNGGVPVVLPVADESDVADALDAVHALVLTGGGDIDPSLYGADAHVETGEVDVERDAWDTALAREALRRDLPVLATCRGLQVLNVALGGTLVQHLPDVADEHREYARWTEGVHRVRVDPDSRLAAALGATDLAVNSLHHQAVGVCAPGLRAVAWAEDGTIEAVEGDSPLVTAVQWHPELHADRPDQQGLFRRLVLAAADRSSAT